MVRIRDEGNSTLEALNRTWNATIEKLEQEQEKIGEGQKAICKEAAGICAIGRTLENNYALLCLTANGNELTARVKEEVVKLDANRIACGLNITYALASIRLQTICEQFQVINTRLETIQLELATARMELAIFQAAELVRG